MDFTVISTLIQTFGFPIAVIVAVSWFFVREVWPWLKSHGDNLFEAVDNNTKALIAITSAVQTIAHQLEVQASAIQKLNEEMNVVATVLEIRKSLTSLTSKE